MELRKFTSYEWLEKGWRLIHSQNRESPWEEASEKFRYCREKIYSAYMESGGLERVSRRLYANPKEADAVYALLPPQWAAKAKEVTGPIVSGAPKTVVFDSGPRDALKHTPKDYPLRTLLSPLSNEGLSGFSGNEVDVKLIPHGDVEKSRSKVF